MYFCVANSHANSFMRIFSAFTRVFLAMIAGSMLYSCSTDFDLNAPYQEETVVYGLLNQVDTLHKVTIRKSYLGTGNAYDYALLADSSEYDTSLVYAVIEEWVDNSMVRSWELNPYEITDKEAGDFYTEGAMAYGFNAPDPTNPNPVYQAGLNTDAIYKLNIKIGEGANEKEITAETPLVADFNLGSPFSILPEVGLANNSSSITNIYPSVNINFVAPEYARRFEVSIRHNYVDYFSAVDSIERNITWKVGSKVTADQTGGDPLEQVVEGQLVFSYIGENTPSDPNVIKRIIRPMDFIITVAGDDLHTYMEVNEPITGIVQERPGYTNITGGRGIFSSRYIKTVTKTLNKFSIQEMSEGQFTGSLLYCSDTYAYSDLGGTGTAESFYCGD